MTDEEFRELFAKSEATTRQGFVELRGEMGQLRTELGGEMGELRTELRGEMTELRTELRGEMTELRTELRGEMGELRGEMGELRGEMGELRGEMGELRGEMDNRFDEMKRYIGIEREANRALIEQVAEGVEAVNEKLDRNIAELRAEMTRGFRDTHELIFWLAKETGVQRKPADRK